MAKDTKERARDRKDRDGKERTFTARVDVYLKPMVNDPAGNTIASALDTLGFASVENVRSGKYFQITLRAPTARKAEKQVDQMCTRLLANPVIESYRFDVTEA